MTVIELGGLSDLDAVVEAWVDLAADQRQHGSHVLPESNRSAIRGAVGSHVLHGGLLVARDEGADSVGDLVGFVTFGPEDGGFELDASRGVIRHLWVREGRRDEGIGSALLAAAEQRLAERGVEQVTLEVLAENEAARRFYRDRGYRTYRMGLEKELDESDSRLGEGHRPSG